VEFSLDDVTKGHVFEFLTHFDGPWTPIQWDIFVAQTFLGN